MIERLLFGTGTGRCGTKSLAILFSQQSKIAVSHERFLLNWQKPSRADLDLAVTMCRREPYQAYMWNGEKWARREHWNREAEHMGDIAPMYLAYTSWLIDYGAKIVCLQRDKDATVDSFLRQRYDHCSERPAPDVRPPELWWPCHPKFPGTREEAARQFWDAFYALAHDFEHKYPAQFRVFPMEALNCEKGQADILYFAGVAPPYVHVTVDSRHAVVTQPCRFYGGTE